MSMQVGFSSCGSTKALEETNAEDGERRLSLAAPGDSAWRTPSETRRWGQDTRGDDALAVCVSELGGGRRRRPGGWDPGLPERDEPEAPRPRPRSLAPSSFAPRGESARPKQLCRKEDPPTPRGNAASHGVCSRGFRELHELGEGGLQLAGLGLEVFVGLAELLLGVVLEAQSSGHSICSRNIIAIAMLRRGGEDPMRWASPPRIRSTSWTRELQATIEEYDLTGLFAKTLEQVRHHNHHRHHHRRHHRRHRCCWRTHHEGMWHTSTQHSNANVCFLSAVLLI